MREQLEKRIKENYDDVIIWDEYEDKFSFYLRFTAAGDFYIAAINKNSDLIQILKEYRRIKL